jgi:hypothetical protein
MAAAHKTDVEPIIHTDTFHHNFAACYDGRSLHYLCAKRSEGGTTKEGGEENVCQ